MEQGFSEISGVMVDESPEQRLERAVRQAKAFYARLAKVAPELLALKFREADEKAAEIILENGDTFITSAEYQNARHDFENMDKINSLLEAQNFRTAKIEYDLREPGLGGWAYEEFYEEAIKRANKLARPVLEEAIKNSDFEKAREVANNYLKAYVGEASRTYERLVELLQPEHYFFEGEDDFYYASRDINVHTVGYQEYAGHALDAISGIAESDDSVEKVLAMIWLVDYGEYDFLDEFSKEPFLESRWFLETLRGSVAQEDPGKVVKFLLKMKQPAMARKVLEVTRRLSEEDYFEIVKKVAEEIREKEEYDDYI